MHLITTTITLSNPEASMAASMGLPAVPDGSPSSEDRNWSPTYETGNNTHELNYKGKKRGGGKREAHYQTLP